MLTELSQEIQEAKSTFPLNDEVISKIYSAIIYVGVDSGTFARLLINTKIGELRLTQSEGSCSCPSRTNSTHR